MWKKTRELWGYFRFRLDPYCRLEAKWREPLATLLTLLEPQQATGFSKVRLGGPHDGGYVMLDDFAGIQGAYSLGIGPDVSWDLDMAARRIPVWQYDPTVAGPAVNHPLFTFQPLWISPRDESGTVSLPTLLAQNNHAGADLVLKMDIESAEWDVLAQMDPDQLGAFRQILIEFHSLSSITSDSWRTQAEKALQKLTRHHQVIHVHGNNLSRIISAGDLRVTDSIEVTLVRRDAYAFAPTDEKFPGPFDRPNSRIFPDIQLGAFRFKT